MKFTRFEIRDLVWLDDIATYGGRAIVELKNDNGETANEVSVRVFIKTRADAQFRETEDLCLSAAVRVLKQAASSIEADSSETVRRRVEPPPKWPADP